MELDMSILPPSIEITRTDFDAFYPLLGRFDMYIQLNRKEGEYYNGEPYDLTLHYSIVVTGRRIDKQGTVNSTHLLYISL
ncbi:hypothetical protein SARC_07709 [Sphaeroforma arctica JP610]|uniref:Uncharacterized protein n=1 Tax=Sphaeroforma arctica JP610 TaxID=667725 RepID=A0A0L0FVE9_9EUKA|nr:hypothetical protein SARC_07709 [Sphaeroforma arctica JP610]KNC79918.1 hypothetical protein SARC_07709 [Sphaeroforma arctica JP610]|eukprot:XP_014153820.1 hypothetical protein SARC_07709 [Sphaeroforma arctica JP610]